MKRIHLLYFVIGSLLVLNLATVSYLFFQKNNSGRMPEKRKMPREIVIEKLHFNDQQIAEYEKLISVHRRAISQTDLKIKESKNALYKTLNDAENKTISDSLISKISTYQIEIERLHYQHFLDIKKICTANQLNDYEELTWELSSIFNPKLRPKNPHRERK